MFLSYNEYLEDLGKNSQKLIPLSPKGESLRERGFGKFSHLETINSVSRETDLLEFYREEGLLTKSGKPRLSCARSYFLDRRGMDLEGLVEYFITWMNYDEYMVLQKQTFDGENFDKKTIAVKCSKRGNDVYKYRVRKRFSFLSTLENKILFDWENKALKKHKSSCLFVTLTFNPSLCGINEAWEVRVGREYNSWITNLRNKFGRVEAIRTFEGYENGYPHIHVVLLFGDVEFNTFKGNNDIWRIQEKKVFELGWKSWVDVQAVKDLKGGLWYLSKHILKNQVVEGDPSGEDDLWKYYLTLALNWIFQKRSFAISGGFLDLMSSMHKSNLNTCVQITLEGDSAYYHVVWVFIGIFSAKKLGISNNSWSVDLSLRDLGRIL